MCECWRCITSRPWPRSARRYEPKWHLGPLLRHCSEDELKTTYGSRTFISWKNFGLTDQEADHVSVLLLKDTPDRIWAGWQEAQGDYWPEETDADA